MQQHITTRAESVGYSREAATALAEMVLGWRDGAAPVLVRCTEILDRARSQATQDTAWAERRVAEKIAHRIRGEFSPDRDVFEPTDVVARRRANCLGYAQLFYVVGRSVGLSITPAGVLELEQPGPLPEGARHVCCLVALSDGTVVMVNLAPAFISRPFVIGETYRKSGCYLVLDGPANPLGIYRRIQLLDEKGLLAHLYNNRGAVLVSQGRFPAALEHYAKAVELNPQFAESWNNRGVALRNCGQLAKALSSYTQAIELDDHHAEAFNNRGLAWAKAGRLTNAVDDYRRAAELNPRSAAVHNNLATAYHQQGRLDDAIAQYSLAIDLDPNLTDAYFNRAIAHGRLGKHQQAVRDYSRALQCSPRLEQAYINRSLSHAALGQYDAARRDLLQAVKVSPTPATRERVNRISERTGLNVQVALGNR